MMPTRQSRLLLPLIIALAPATALPSNLRAQEPARLLRLVPEDFGFVLVVHDLRDQIERWGKSEWVKKVAGSPLAAAVAGSPEVRELLELKKNLEKHLNLEWPALRDGVLGDAVALAYRPGPDGKAEGEQGLVLLRAPREEVLVTLLDAVNALQKKSGELKELEQRKHRGITYFRRVHDKSKQFYSIRDGLFIFCGSEEVLKSVLDRDAGMAPPSSVWPRAMERFAQPRSFATLLINPRAFDAEFKHKASDDPLQAKIGEWWSTLEAVGVNARMEDALEVRLSLLAREKAAAPKALFRPSEPNPLWAYFPEQALIAAAGRVDLTLTGDLWQDLVHKAARDAYLDALQRSIGPQIHPLKVEDILPHVGPEWGIAIFASEKEKHVPQVVAALAASPGGKEIDKALYQSLRRFAGFATLSQPDIRLQTVVQGKVEVTYLESDKHFPPGFRPALAVKEGYLLLASSPEGIERFRPDSRHVPRKDNLFLRFSARETGFQVRAYRTFLVENVAKGNGIPQAKAEQIVDGILTVLELFDRVELSETTTRDQLTLLLRVSP